MPYFNGRGGTMNCAGRPFNSGSGDVKERSVNPFYVVITVSTRIHFRLRTRFRRIDLGLLGGQRKTDFQEGTGANTAILPSALGIEACVCFHIKGRLPVLRSINPSRLVGDESLADEPFQDAQQPLCATPSATLSKVNPQERSISLAWRFPVDEGFGFPLCAEERTERDSAAECITRKEGITGAVPLRNSRGPYYIHASNPSYKVQGEPQGRLIAKIRDGIRLHEREDKQRKRLPVEDGGLASC
ncbi:hypothetical protein B0H16DRAFT_1449184 [Mycena metata]|uniref:Uncharacterized protein n=1 Tax=Mycena metata TaxID=1033252 RepID=A0AAD7K2U6_9AGAR|nr:hypothetical protein B0H16DRAFT_1449184 [Mycena metata]